MLIAASAVASLMPLLILIAIIVVCITVWFVMTWEAEPWWRKFPTPRRQINIDKDRITDYKIRKRHPEVFGDEPLPIKEIEGQP